MSSQPPRAQPPKRFLVCHDYGMGGLWFYVCADTKEQLLGLYDGIVAFDEPPSWTTDEFLAGIRTIDIADTYEMPLFRSLRRWPHQRSHPVGLGDATGPLPEPFVMRGADIAAAAARQCIRLGMGFTKPHAVVQWADAVILAQPAPSGEIIALSSAFASPGWVVLDRVKALTTREALVDALREAAGEVLSRREQGGLVLRDGVERLLGWARALDLAADAKLDHIYWTLDCAAENLDVADEGILRHDDVDPPIIEALAQLARGEKARPLPFV